jgi:predicted aspartyl protease
VPRRPSLVPGALLLALAIGIGGVLPAGCTDPRRSTDATVADSASGELPFRLAGPGGAAIVVPVYINGHGPVDLILDTGATLTCVDTAFARRLALPVRRGMLGMGVTVGGSGRLALHAVDSLRVGGAVARKLTVCAMDLRALQSIERNVHGLLGLNVLREFRVTLDFERSVLRLADPSS